MLKFGLHISASSSTTSIRLEVSGFIRNNKALQFVKPQGSLRRGGAASGGAVSGPHLHSGKHLQDLPKPCSTAHIATRKGLRSRGRAAAPKLANRPSPPLEDGHSQQKGQPDLSASRAHQLLQCCVVWLNRGYEKLPLYGKYYECRSTPGLNGTRQLVAMRSPHSPGAGEFGQVLCLLSRVRRAHEKHPELLVCNVQCAAFLEGAQDTKFGSC